MARRGQTINVKVPRKKVIAALDKALKKLEADYANQEKLEKQYQAEVDKWLANIYKKVKSNKPRYMDTRYDGIEVRFDVPKSMLSKPEKKFTVINDWQYRESKEEIENALRVLNMCEDEFISTATYGNINKYL